MLLNQKVDKNISKNIFNCNLYVTLRLIVRSVLKKNTHSPEYNIIVLHALLNKNVKINK